MKKLILAVLLLFVLTGCDVKYDLVITNDEQIRENITVSIDNQIINNNSMSIDEYLDYYSNLYMENPGYSGIKIDTKKGKNVSYFIAKNEYASLDDYIASYTFKNMFNTATIERVGNYISFTTSENTYLANIENDQLISEQSKYDSFKINIKFYNKLANHNADEVDEKNNIYSWNIDENSTKNFIYFKISPDIRYDVMIKDIIQNNILLISSIGALLLIIVILTLYVVIKIRKNNEI